MVRLRPFALSPTPPESPTTWPGAVVANLGDTPAPSSDCAPDVRRDVVDKLSATGAFPSDAKLEFRGDLDA
jgi:hypothetical protein